MNAVLAVQKVVCTSLGAALAVQKAPPARPRHKTDRAEGAVYVQERLLWQLDVLDVLDH